MLETPSCAVRIMALDRFWFKTGDTKYEVCSLLSLVIIFRILSPSASSSLISNYNRNSRLRKPRMNVEQVWVNPRGYVARGNVHLEVSYQIHITRHLPNNMSFLHFVRVNLLPFYFSQVLQPLSLSGTKDLELNYAFKRTKEKLPLYLFWSLFSGHDKTIVPRSLPRDDYARCFCEVTWQ